MVCSRAPLPRLLVADVASFQGRTELPNLWPTRLSAWGRLEVAEALETGRVRNSSLLSKGTDVRLLSLSLLKFTVNLRNQ